MDRHAPNNNSYAQLRNRGGISKSLEMSEHLCSYLESITEEGLMTQDKTNGCNLYEEQLNTILAKLY